MHRKCKQIRPIVEGSGGSRKESKLEKGRGSTFVPIEEEEKKVPEPQKLLRLTHKKANFLLAQKYCCERDLVDS